MENIIIPIVEPSYDGLGTSTSSTSNAESSNKWSISEKIDFSCFPENLFNSATEDLQNIIIQLEKKLTENQNQIKTIVNPNLKVHI